MKRQEQRLIRVANIGQLLFSHPNGMNCLAGFLDEAWTPITDNTVPNIKPNYLISTKGRIFSKNTNTIMKLNTDISGYSTIKLFTNDKKAAYKKVHRVVLLEFAYFPGCENFQVNHIDGNKKNNFIENLEWCTQNENMKHAYKMGRATGQRIVYSDEVIHIMCKCLEANMSYRQITDVLGVPYTRNHARLFKDLARKNRYAHIASQYNIVSKYDPKSLTNDQIHCICQLFSCGQPVDNSYILSSIGIDTEELTDEEYREYSMAFARIRRRESYIEISKFYPNF